MASYNFHFSLSDLSFHNWLTQGLSQIGDCCADGTTKIDKQFFVKELEDRDFNGLSLSNKQCEYLVTLFKGQTIVLDEDNQFLCQVDADLAKTSVKILEKASDFFAACGLNFITGAGDTWGRARNFFAERIMDTGTRVEALESVLRSISSPTEFRLFKDYIERDFRSKGNCFEDILSSELSGRQLGRIFGICTSLGFEEDHYIQKAYGFVGARASQESALFENAAHGDQKAQAELANQVTDFRTHCQNKLKQDYLKDLKLDAHIIDQTQDVRVLSGLLVAMLTVRRISSIESLKNHFSFTEGWMGCLTELCRQDQDATTLDAVIKAFLGILNNITQLLKGGQPVPDKALVYLNEKMGQVTKEIDIFLSQEKAGVGQVESSYIAAEMGSYTAIGAVVALYTGGLAAGAFAAKGAFASTLYAVFTGGCAGTVVETSVRQAERIIVKNDKTSLETVGADLHESATNSFSTSLGLGAGVVATKTGKTLLTKRILGTEYKLNQLISPDVMRQVGQNQIMATSNAMLRSDDTFGLDNLLIAGGSGFVGGKLVRHIQHNWALEKSVEMGREVAENLVESHFDLEGGNITAEELIQSFSGALTEMGGGFKGVKHTKRKQIQRMFQSQSVTTPKTGLKQTYHSLENCVGLSFALMILKSTQPEHDVDSIYHSLTQTDNMRQVTDEVGQHVRIENHNLYEDIFLQSGDEYRSIVELVSNGLDSGSQEVFVETVDGEYVVKDFGKGMNVTQIFENLIVPKVTGKPDPKKQTGRFGFGFYTAMKHLKQNGDQVVVETKACGDEALRAIFLRYNDEILFRLEGITPNNDNNGFLKDLEEQQKDSGTQVRVVSQNLDPVRAKDKISEFLRFVNPMSQIAVNGDVINEQTSLNRIYESENLIVEDCESGRQGITVKVGNVVIEQMPYHGTGFDSEIVITLPQDTRHNVSRDQVLVDETVVNSFRELVALAQDESLFPEKSQKVAFLNTLAPLAKAWQRGAYRDECMQSLRYEMARLVSGRTVYPDTFQMREHLSVVDHELFFSSQDEAALVPVELKSDYCLVAPELLPDDHAKSFKIPTEVQGTDNKTIDANGQHRPLAIVLSHDLQPGVASFFDEERAVLYVSDAYYSSAPKEVFMSEALIDNQRYKVTWQSDGSLVLEDKPVTNPLLVTDEIKSDNNVESSQNKISQTVQRPAMAAQVPLEHDILRFANQPTEVVEALSQALLAAGVQLKNIIPHQSAWDMRPSTKPYYRWSQNEMIDSNGVVVFEGKRIERVGEEKKSKYSYYFAELESHELFRKIGDLVIFNIDIKESNDFTFSHEGKNYAVYQGMCDFYLKNSGFGPVVSLYARELPTGIENSFLLYPHTGKIRKIFEASDQTIGFFASDPMDEFFYFSESKRFGIQETVSIFDEEGNVLFSTPVQQKTHAKFHKILNTDEVLIALVDHDKGMKLYDEKGNYLGSKAPSYDVRETKFFRNGKDIVVIEINRDRKVTVSNLSKQKTNVHQITDFSVNCWHKNGVCFWDGSNSLAEFIGSDGTLRVVDDVSNIFRIKKDSGGDTFAYVVRKKDDDVYTIYNDAYLAFFSASSIIGRSKFGFYYNGYAKPIHFDYEGNVLQSEAEVEAWAKQSAEWDDPLSRYEFFDYMEDGLFSEQVINRLNQIAEMEILDQDYGASLVFASDAAWNALIHDPLKRQFLSCLISNPMFERFVAVYPHSTIHELNLAKKLLSKMQFAYGDDQDLKVLRKAKALIDAHDLSLDEILESGRKGALRKDWHFIHNFLRNAVSELLCPGEDQLQGVSSPLFAGSLGSLITATRAKTTSPNSLAELANQQPQVAKPIQRELIHAIEYSASGDPFLFVREFFKFSLDKSSADKRTIKINAYNSESSRDQDLTIRLEDSHGFSEASFLTEFLGLNGHRSQQTTSHKPNYLALLQGAHQVRIKTAASATDRIVFATLDVERDSSGKITDIQCSLETKDNTEDFSGTLIETRMMSQSPMLDAYRFRNTVEDMTPYLDAGVVQVTYNGKLENDVQPVLAFDSWNGLGKVHLYEGKDNKILIGGIPVCSIPESAWQKIPENIRAYFRQQGFYLDFDPQYVTPTINWNGIAHPHHDEFLKTLESRLPGILIKGYLQKVLQQGKSEDLFRLPDTYFSKAYGFAETENLGRDIIEDAKILNGENSDDNVDYDKYTDETNLIKLITLINFIPDDSGNIFSIRDVYHLVHSNKSKDKAKLAELMPKLPGELKSRVEITKRNMSYQESIIEQAALIRKDIDDCKSTDKKEKTNRMQREFYLKQDQISHPAYQMYFTLVDAILKTYYKGHVIIGIQNVRDHLGSFALHYEDNKQADEPTYYLYRSVGPILQQDVDELVSIFETKNSFERRRQFGHYVARLQEVLTHELTHVYTESPYTPTFTHTPEFYQAQQTITVTEQNSRLNIVELYKRFRRVIKEQGADMPSTAWQDFLKH